MADAHSVRTPVARNYLPRRVVPKKEGLAFRIQVRGAREAALVERHAHEDNAVSVANNRDFLKSGRRPGVGAARAEKRGG